MTTAPRLLAAVIVLVAAACSAASQNNRSAPADRSVLTAEQIRGTSHSDAYSLVTALRPNWLRTRGSPSGSQGGLSVRVYLDGSLMGGPDHLRQITTRSISSIRYLDGNEATQRWGMNHGLGAIVVTTLR